MVETTLYKNKYLVRPKNSVPGEQIIDPKQRLLNLICATLIKEPSFASELYTLPKQNPFEKNGEKRKKEEKKKNPFSLKHFHYHYGNSIFEVEMQFIRQLAAVGKHKLLGLIIDVCRRDFEYVLKLAFYVRQELNIRSTANFLLAAAFTQTAPEYDKIIWKYYHRVIQLPSDWLEVVSFYVIIRRHLNANWLSYHPDGVKTMIGRLMSTNDDDKRKKLWNEKKAEFICSREFPSIMKKVMIEKFFDFDAYSLAKYNKENSLRRKTLRDRYRDIQNKKKTKKKKGVEPAKPVSVEEEESDEESDDEDFELIDFAAEEDKKKAKTIYPPSQKPAFTMKKMIRILHINQPVYYVQALLGKNYPETAEEFEARGLAKSIPTRKPKPTEPFTFDVSMVNHRMRLPIPKTWETQLSESGNKHTTWQALIDSNNLPFMAMLRNLRNLLMTGVEPKYHEWAQAKLSDKDTILHSRQFPFRFFSAYQAINVDIKKLAEYKKMNAEQLNEIRNTKVRVIVPHHVPTAKIIQNYRDALDKAVQLSVTNNIPTILGRTSILCNVAATMQSSTAGSAVGDFTSPVEIGLLLALMCYYVVESPDSDFIIFSSPGVLNPNTTYMNLTTYKGEEDDIRRGREMNYLKKGFILDNMKRILTLTEQMGGESQLPMDYLQSITKTKTIVDQIVLFGTHMDNDESYDLKCALKEYRRHVNPNVLFVSVDLFGTGTSVVSTNEGESHPNDVLVTGFSDSILKFIAERSNQAQIRYVQNIDKKKNIVPPVRLASSKNTHRGKHSKIKPYVPRVTQGAVLAQYHYNIEDQHTEQTLGVGTFQSITSRCKYTLALDSQSRLLVCGELGILSNGRVSESPLKCIVSSQDLDGPIIKYSAGANHVIVISANGTAYGLGDNDQHQLGAAVEASTTKPVKIEIPEKIVDIACGAQYSVLLGEKGNTYTCGSNNLGNLGTYDSNKIPTKLGPTRDWDYKEKKEKEAKWIETATQVACGGSHTCVINHNMELWTWGNNEFGQLGRGTVGSYYTPGVVTFFTEKSLEIIQVRCGEYHTIAMTGTSELYAFGLGTNGQLGNGIKVSERIPVLISTFPPHYIKDFDCGKRYSVALTKTGKVFRWGNFAAAVDYEETALPSLVKEASNVQSVSVGDDHFSILYDSFGQYNRELLTMINDSMFSTLSLRIKAGLDHVSLAVHDYMLKIRSQEFVSMFCPTVSPNCEILVDIDEISKTVQPITTDTFLLLIEYIYTDSIGHFKPDTQIDYNQLKKWAQKLNMKRLESLCDPNALPAKSTLQEDMIKLRSEGTNDWAIKAKDESMAVHAAVLVARSEYMRSLFLFAKVEQPANQAHGVVTLETDVSAEAMSCVLDYLYTDVFEATPTTAVDVLQVANEYCLPNLQTTCEHQFADFYEMVILRGSCIKFILDHIDEVYALKDYRDLSKRSTLLADEIKQLKKNQTKRKQEHYQHKK